MASGKMEKGKSDGMKLSASMPIASPFQLPGAVGRRSSTSDASVVGRVTILDDEGRPEQAAPSRSPTSIERGNQALVERRRDPSVAQCDGAAFTLHLSPTRHCEAGAATGEEVITRRGVETQACVRVVILQTNIVCGARLAENAAVRFRFFDVPLNVFVKQ